MTQETVDIHTDGACSPNPGVGGWAAILTAPGKGAKTREISGGERRTTNNRMELTAAIRALEALKRPCVVNLCTDSQYLRNAFTQGWLDKWQRNGWKTASKKPVENQDLWLRLLELTAIHTVKWLWVRGHADDPLNERCDQLAVAAREKVARRASASRTG